MLQHRRILQMFAATLALGTLAAAPAAANSVEIGSATAQGGTATVSGSAAFPAITAPQSVVGANAVNAAGAAGGSAAGDAAGLKLTDATILPIPGGLRFQWKIAGMPAQVPPDGVRYTWAFIAGNAVYQLQAKRTNLASATTAEDPLGHVSHATKQQDFFQLRGACSTAYLGSPIAGCYHLAFLSGRFDTEASTVTVDLPYETRDSIGRIVGPDIKPGAVLVDNGGEGSAGMTIAASFQAVVSNTIMSRYINGIDPYYVGPRVSLAVGTPTTGPQAAKYTSTATLAPDGTFTGTVAGVTATANRLFVRACNGTVCSYATQDLD